MFGQGLAVWGDPVPCVVPQPEADDLLLALLKPGPDLATLSSPFSSAHTRYRKSSVDDLLDPVSHPGHRIEDPSPLREALGLHHLDAGAVADRFRTVLQRRDSSHVEVDGSIELSAFPPEVVLVEPNNTPTFSRSWLMKIAVSSSGLARR